MIRSRYMQLALLLFLLLAAVQPAIAQTTNYTATVRYTAPTTRTDGVPISGPLTYHVYEGARGGTKTRIATFTGLSGQVPNSAPGRCFEVSAVEGNFEGARSPEACLPAAPNGVTGVTVTVTVTITATP